MSYYSPEACLFIGISISLSASCLSSLGVNLQAAALVKERALNALAEVPLLDEETRDIEEEGIYIQELPNIYVPAPRGFWPALNIIFATKTGSVARGEALNVVWIKSQWYVGFILYILVQIFGSIAALAFISPMIVAPLGAAGLIFNILFSSVFLGTVITRFDWLGTLLIVVGCALLSTFGIVEEPTKTIDHLVSLFTRPAFIAYLTTQIVIVLFFLSMAQFLIYSLKSMASAVTTRLNSIRTSVRSRLRAASLGGSMDLAHRQVSSNFTHEPKRSVSSPHNDVSNGLQRNSSMSGIYESPTDDSTPLLRANSTSNISLSGTHKRGKITEFVGMMYAMIGGITAGQTLLLTKSGVEGLELLIHEPFNNLHITFVMILWTLIIAASVCQVSKKVT